MAKKGDASLYKAFTPIRRRLVFQHFIQWAFWGLIAAIGSGIIWKIISFIIPTLYISNKIAYTGIIVISASLVVAWLMKPHDNEMVKEADKLGFEERISTAYELRERNDAFAKVQRQDTIDRLNNFNPKTIPIKVPQNTILLATSLLLVLIIGFIIPNPQDKVINERMRAKKILTEQLERLNEDSADRLVKETDLTKEEQEELKRLLAQLSDQLRQAQDYRQAIKEISKTEEKIIEMLQKAREQSMTNLGLALSRQEAFRPLGESISEIDAEGIKSEMEKLKEQAKNQNMDDETIKALQSALEQAANELQDGAIKDQLRNIANEIGENLYDDTMNLVGSLDDLEAMLTEMSQNPLMDAQELLYELQDMKNKIALAGNQEIDKSQIAQSDKSGDSNSGSDTLGETPGDNQGSSDQSGQGHDNQNGQGNASQSGQGQGQGRQGSSGIGTAHPEYERILDPKRLGDGGSVSQVKGHKDEEGSSHQVEAGQGMGSLDGFIPYNEVFGEYKRQAMENIERQNIPSNMREWVKAYFSALE